MSEKNFADGIRVTRRETAPEFVVCQLGIHVEKLTAWLNQHVNQAGFVNVDVKRSKNGNLYSELDNWKPNTEKVKEALGGPNLPQDDGFDSDIPFFRKEF